MSRPISDKDIIEGMLNGIATAENRQKGRDALRSNPAEVRANAENVANGMFDMLGPLAAAIEDLDPVKRYLACQWIGALGRIISMAHERFPTLPDPINCKHGLAGAAIMLAGSMRAHGLEPGVAPPIALVITAAAAKSIRGMKAKTIETAADAAESVMRLHGVTDAVTTISVITCLTRTLLDRLDDRENDKAKAEAHNVH